MDGARKAHLFVRGKISVPVSQVKTVAADTEQMFAEAGTSGPVVAHAATGILYFMCADDGLSADRIRSFRLRYRALFAVIGLAMLVTVAGRDRPAVSPVRDCPPPLTSAGAVRAPER